MRRGTREVCFSCLSHTPLSFFPITFRVFYLCLSCVLGYGWKRLDFDSSNVDIGIHCYRTTGTYPCIVLLLDYIYKKLGEVE